MEEQKKPFLYTLLRDGEDFIFKRVMGSPSSSLGLWGLHLDIEDPTPAKVLIFVHAGTDAKLIMDEINRAQTFFREQIEPRFPTGE